MPSSVSIRWKSTPGSFDVYINDQLWFPAGLPVSIHTHKGWQSAKDTLVLDRVVNTTGRDVLGTFNRTEWRWKHGFSTAVRTYMHAVAFEQHFAKAIVGTSTGDPDGLISTFPSFAVSRDGAPERGYLQYSGWQGCSKYRAGRWGHERSVLQRLLFEQSGGGELEAGHGVQGSANKPRNGKFDTEFDRVKGYLQTGRTLGALLALLCVVVACRTASRNDDRARTPGTHLCTALSHRLCRIVVALLRLARQVTVALTASVLIVGTTVAMSAVGLLPRFLSAWAVGTAIEISTGVVRAERLPSDARMRAWMAHEHMHATSRKHVAHSHSHGSDTP